MQNNFIIEHSMNVIMLQNLGPVHQHIPFTADALSAFEDALSSADTEILHADMPELEDFDFNINY
jgi:hypothetical protein